jgi:hypothetical protein
LPAVSLADAREHPELETPTLEVVFDWTMVRLWTKQLDRRTARWLLGVSREHEDVKARTAAINAMGTAIVGARDGFLFTRPPSTRIQRALIKRLMEGVRDLSNASVRLAALAALIDAGVGGQRDVFGVIDHLRRDEDPLVRDLAASFVASQRAGGCAVGANQGRSGRLLALRAGLCVVLGLALSGLVVWVYRAWEPAGVAANCVVCVVAVVLVLRAACHWNDTARRCPNCGGRRVCR